MARRFHFPLATLLRVRQLREQEARRKVSAKRAEIARLDRLNEQTAAAILEQQAGLLATQRQGHLDTQVLQAGRAWVSRLRRTITLRQIERARLVEELHELQVALHEARRKARIIEKLRERRWQVYRQDRQRAEQAEADELAQQLHAYRSA